MTRYNTRALVESALLAVIGLVLVLLGQYVPFLGIAASLLGPLPSALVVLRHGMRGVMASSHSRVPVHVHELDHSLKPVVLFGLTGLVFGYAVLKYSLPNYGYKRRFPRGDSQRIPDSLSTNRVAFEIP